MKSSHISYLLVLKRCISCCAMLRQNFTLRSVFVLLLIYRLQFIDLTLLLYFVQNDVKVWVSKNRGKPLYRMFKSSEYAHSCFILHNMHQVWEQQWTYHVENRETCQAHKESFAKYGSWSEEEAIKHDELDNWKRYKAVKPRFTGNVPREKFAENISAEGRAYYYKNYLMFERFMSLPESDVRMQEFGTIWDELESEHKFVEHLTSRKGRKRKATDDGDASVEEDDVVSPTSVVMPNEPGHLRYIEQMLSAAGGGELRVVGV